MENTSLGMYDYLNALGDGRLEDAKRHLLKVIDFEKGKSTAPVISDIVQKLGLILLRQGDRLSALALYELSESVDADSLLAKLNYAKFLFRDAGDIKGAVAKCEEIIAKANSNPFPESDNDFSSEEYLEAATRLLNDLNG